MSATDAEIEEAVHAYLEAESAALDAAIDAVVAPYVARRREIKVLVNGERVGVTIDVDVTVDIGVIKLNFDVLPGEAQ